MEKTNGLSNLREWAPLTDLLNKIPSKPNLNIFSEEVKITCVDILPEFIALGTNYGMAYWYDRKTKELKRLRCENSNIPITSIKVLSTVDFMLACGSTSGNISIFQIPKVHPDWIPEKLKPKNKSVERYTVSELHKSAITALEWSKNGMKLFSGDKDGTVVLTEIDFYMHICKSLEILNETYEVVQLSYSNPKLVVSTTYRSIICEQADKWTVMQVGRQDRKILGAFGGIIQQNKLKSKDAVIYCTRPGLRLWVSDDHGVVQKTLVFKEILKKDCAEVPLLNPVSKHFQCKSPKDVNFGIILQFGEHFLVTYNSNVVYILDLENMTVVSKISHLRRVLDVSCHKDEIFILEEDRNLIRISTRPEINCDESSISSEEGLFLPSSIKGITSKLQPSAILSVIPPVIGHTLINISEHTDDELIMNAEEALEVQISPQNEVPPKRFDNIEVDDSTEILYKHKKTKKKKHEKNQDLESKPDSHNSTEKNICVTQPTLMNMSTVGQLPDLRSPQTILSSIEQKEKLLAAFLTYDKNFAENSSNKQDLSGQNQNSNINIPIKEKTEMPKLNKPLIGERNSMASSVDIDEGGNKIDTKLSPLPIDQPYGIITNKKSQRVCDEMVWEKEKKENKISKEKLQNEETSKYKKENSEQTVIGTISEISINDKIMDYGGLIDIEKILTLQESRTSEFKDNFKSPFSNGKVMKKSQTSVMNENTSFFGSKEKRTDELDDLSISHNSAISKTKKGVGATKAIPIMSKSTDMPGATIWISAVSL
ncbi:WD repeat-containing protein CG11141 isoform X2 [Coccinella septempunctata]|uniref:WD repeat-containing protein CG11141 isoform X2 n=1 Tax=Coccinella septempunctata TaxID=41139 RepID=UPI001D0827F2|nr:WD repeat-containing protein CG11141 isoform X2 [Coccinella septempunctata]